MHFPELATLVSQGAFYSIVRQELLSDLLDQRLGTYRWQVDMDGPTLSFLSEERPDTRLDLPAEMIASVAPGPRSMLWGWTHPQSAGAASELVRAYGDEHGIEVLTQPEVPLRTEVTDEALGDEVAQVVHEVGQAVVGILGRAPYYSAPAGGGTRVLFLVDGPELPRPRIDEALSRHLMSAAGSGATADHRTSFHWLAVHSGWELTWDEQWTSAEIRDPENGNTATAAFTPEGLLSGVQLHLGA